MRKFYERYWENEPEELLDFRYKWPKLSTFIPNKRCVILDYGCGKGKILSEIRRINPQASLYGADVSKIACQSSKKKVPTAKILEITDDQRVSIDAYSCDFVLSLDVIEHIYDTEKVFIEFERLVKKGGYLLVSTPYFGFLKNIIIACVGFDIIFDPKTPHIRFYTKKSLVALLEEHGFKVEKFGYYGRFPFVWRGMYALASKL